MSYDLYLFSESLTNETFRDYFIERTHYKNHEPTPIELNTNTYSTHYLNEETGIYFSFNFFDRQIGNESVEFHSLDKKSHVHFEINYIRPHVFGIEAASELTAFVNKFNCSIQDPQMNGMGNGAYSEDGFIKGWNLGNAIACEGFAKISQLHDCLVVNEDWIKNVWLWNLKKNILLLYSTKRFFLPKIIWARQIKTNIPIAFVTWGESTPTAIPECVTHVLLCRYKERTNPKSGMEFKLLSIKSVAALDGCKWHKSILGNILLAPANLPPSKKILSSFEGNFSNFDLIAKIIPFDHVLDTSLISPKLKSQRNSFMSKIMTKYKWWNS